MPSRPDERARARATRVREESNGTIPPREIITLLEKTIARTAARHRRRRVLTAAAIVVLIGVLVALVALNWSRIE